jgi:phenylalanyl-tRNA synthetase beta chain
MKFSEQWLREWVDPPLSTRQLADQLTMAGLEVDSVESVAQGIQGVVVGRVLDVRPHPDAERLRVCTVDVQEETPLDVVCGAPNVYPGMLAPVARVGASLPNGMKIKRAKLRGVESQGMLCSAKELGIADDSSGLMELPTDAPIGLSLIDYLDLNDHSIDVDLTPNRSDCLSIAGIAREVGVLNRCEVAPPTMEPVAAVIDDCFSVYVEAHAACPRYAGRVIRGVNGRASTPLWMRERLRRSGLRSIGPVVDVTNYVLLELGQPMHAFDLGKLSGAITVRWARDGEQITLLDGQTLALDAETLVIADGSGAQAMAGIMGGSAAAVETDACDLFLESAFFAPEAISGRARSYGLHTESSHRFERGVDPGLQRRALERATDLLVGIVGGRPGPVIEVASPGQLPRPATVALRRQRIERVLGVPIGDEDVADILRRQGMEFQAVESGWEVSPPSFRFDVAVEVDLIEDIGRIYGYERLPTRRPHGELAMAAQSEARLPLARLREVLLDRGYQEAITYSFVEPRLQEILDPGREPVALSNPISADMSVMRTSLWPGLLQACLHNIKRQQARIRLFESGLRFVREGGEIRQELMLAGLLTGAAAPEQWGEAPRAVDFYDIKGDVEGLLALSGVAHTFSIEPDRHPALHPGRSACLRRDGELVGWLGGLHPGVAKGLGLADGVYVFELAVAALVGSVLPQYRETSRFPGLRRDLSIIVDKSVPARAVTECIGRSAGEILQEQRLFDVYAGQGIEPGRKSLTLGLTLQHPSRTLTDGEVDEVIDKIVAQLGDELDARLRT